MLHNYLICFALFLDLLYTFTPFIPHYPSAPMKHRIPHRHSPKLPVLRVSSGDITRLTQMLRGQSASASSGRYSAATVQKMAANLASFLEFLSEADKS